MAQRTIMCGVLALFQKLMRSIRALLVFSMLALICINRSVLSQDNYRSPSDTTSIVWSDDGSYIALGKLNGEVEIYDTNIGKTLHLLRKHTDRVEVLAFSHDDKFLATGSNDTTVKLWDVKTGVLCANLTGHEDSIFALLWLPENRLMSVGAAYYEAENTRVWDVKNEREIAREGNGPINNLSLNYTEDSIIGGGIDRVKTISPITYTTISVFDIVDSDTVGFPASVSSIEWSPDGKTFVTGLPDGQVTVYDTQTGATIYLWSGSDSVGVESDYPTSYIHDVQFSENGRRLSSIAYDGTLRMWDVNSGEMLLDTVLGNGIQEASFSPDGTKIAFSSIGVPLVVEDIPNP